jgi:hypothetical protein
MWRKMCHIFRHIFLSNYWWHLDLIFGHKLHIGTPYRGKRFWTHQIPTSCLPTLLIFLHIEHICSFLVAFFSANQISVIDSCWEKCDEKCAYMFNVYKDQLSRQTGSRNLTDPKTVPTIWYTYMMLVTKYQISAINSHWEKCDKKYLGRTEGQTDRGKTLYPTPPSGSGGIKIHMNHKHHIGIPYCGYRFWIRQIPTSCLPT